VLHAVATNAVASVAPRAYVRLTGQTGREERAKSTPAETARYFERSFEEYFERLQIAPHEVSAYLNGKTVLEYGPGDLPGVALLMVAYGAARVICVDRFPLVRFDEFAVAVIRELLAALGEDERRRAEDALADPRQPSRGLRGDRIAYRVAKNGLSGLVKACDLAVSRAVLEHVNDLPGTILDVCNALKPGAMTVHKVDLRSHGLHERTPLDFLTWPATLWSAMYSAKGVPNRLRVDAYRRALEMTRLEVLLLAPDQRYSQHEIDAVRERLPRQFAHLTDEDLSWQSFWLAARKQVD
jgi:hypothetical protein